MRVALVNPLIAVDAKTAVRDLDVGEHVGLGLLAACLRRHGHVVQIRDVQEGGPGVDGVAAFSPDLVGVSVMSQTYPQAMAIASALKGSLGKPIVVGGVLPTILGDRFLGELDPSGVVDFMVVGDGEDALVELADALSEGDRTASRCATVRGLLWRHEGRIVRNAPRPLRHDLDELPFPARDQAAPVLAELARMGAAPALRLVSSRGCYGACLFCHIQEYYRAANGRAMWRHRSAANLVEEMEALTRELSVRHFLLCDDNFFGPKGTGHARAEELADRIVARKLEITFSIQARIDALDARLVHVLRQAGLVSIDCAVETVEPGSLRFLQKRIDMESILRGMEVLSGLQGVATGIYMLNVHPLSSVRETRRNHDFLDRIGYFDGKDRDREIYRKLVATYCEITKYSRMYRAVERRGLLGEPYPGNPVMFHFRFADRTMEELFRVLTRQAAEHGLTGFGEYFLDLLRHYERRR